MTNAVGQVPGSLIDWAAGVVGIPSPVVSSQISLESGGDPAALSPTGAQGVAQFEPGTWSGLGCAGSPYNVNDGMRCYAKYMYQLVQQFHGNVRDALAAYNAGPGNLSAGYGYADQILSAAGQSSGLQAGQGSPSSAGVTSAQQQQEAAGANCAWSIGGQHIGILFGHGPSLPTACLITKTEIRAFMGGLIMVAGGLVMLPGIILLAAYGLKATGVAQKATQAAGMIPGYGGAARAVTGRAAAGGAARSAGRPSRPGQRITAAERAQAQRNRAALDRSVTRAEGEGGRGRARPQAGRYRVTERTPLSGEMGGTRTVTYMSSRRPRAARPRGAESG